MSLSGQPRSYPEESDAVKAAERKPIQKYKPIIEAKESPDEPPYSIAVEKTLEGIITNITVNFGDFRLSINDGIQRDENGKITSDSKPYITHNNEGLMYPEDIQKMELPESPYEPTGNDLADAFLKALNFYFTSFYGKQVILTDDEIKNVVGQAKIRTNSNI